MTTLEILFSLGLIFLATYCYYTRTYSFWSSRGVAGPRPWLFFGNSKDLMLGKVHTADYVSQHYKNHRGESMFGLYERTQPVLVLTDPELIRDVLIKDFPIFSDRGVKIYERVEPLSQHLFLLEPRRWRPLRARLTPTFSSACLKRMFHLLAECGRNFERHLDALVRRNPVIECRDLAAKYTIEVIGVCAFGLDANCASDANNEFLTVCRKAFAASWKRFIRVRVRDLTPWFYEHLFGRLLGNGEVNRFFVDLVRNTIDYRKRKSVKKHDFLDLLMSIWDDPNKVADVEMTDELLTAQAYVFFIAGFETSSTTISNALYELALNPSIQQKVREEIWDELSKTDGQVKYETIKDMKYLHKVFSETLRKYPPIAVLTRKSQKPYTFKGTKVSIPTEQMVWIPTYSFHRDPDIYPEPDVFDPERFSEENIRQRHASFYLPFGNGPRNCIGARFGVYQTMFGLIEVLKNYAVEVCNETRIPYVNNPGSSFLTPAGGITLKFTKL